MNITEEDQLLQTLYVYFSRLYMKHENPFDATDMSWVKDKWYPMVKKELRQRTLEARIAENQMYLRETERHYFPAGPKDPYIPVVQFYERLAHLSKETKEKL